MNDFLEEQCEKFFHFAELNSAHHAACAYIDCSCDTIFPQRPEYVVRNIVRLKTLFERSLPYDYETAIGLLCTIARKVPETRDIIACTFEPFFLGLAEGWADGTALNDKLRELSEVLDAPLPATDAVVLDIARSAVVLKGL